MSFKCSTVTGWGDTLCSLARFRHHANRDLTVSTADFANLSSSYSSLAFAIPTGLSQRLLTLLTEPRRYTFPTRCRGSCRRELPISATGDDCRFGHWLMEHGTLLSPHPLLWQPFTQLTTRETFQKPSTKHTSLGRFLNSCVHFSPTCVWNDLDQTRRCCWWSHAFIVAATPTWLQHHYWQCVPAIVVQLMAENRTWIPRKHCDNWLEQSHLLPKHSMKRKNPTRGDTPPCISASAPPNSAKTDKKSK